MKNLAVIVHNVRSCHNVGSILRSADGFGAKVYFTGFTPYPRYKSDQRLPHLANKIHRQIAKTSLGAEESVDWNYDPDIFKLIDRMKQQGYRVVALEQAKNSVPLNTFVPSSKTAIIVGREVEGLEKQVIKAADKVVEIPMDGKKESFNVSVAAAICMYQIKTR